MFEIYYWSTGGDVAVFPKGENKGRYFYNNIKPLGAIFRSFLTYADKLISFAECPEKLQENILEYCPELKNGILLQ